jgi:hypothetical protein
MSDRTTPDATEGDPDPGDSVPALPAGPDPRETVEVYESEDGVVLHDSERPLAWLQSTYTVAIEDAR